MEWVSVLLCVILLKGCLCFEWSANSLPEAMTLYACPGNTVTLPWEVTLRPGESIGETRWLYHGQSEEAMAISSHGTFLPLPSFGSRVSAAASNAGITLSAVTHDDMGDYSVEVTGYNSDGFVFTMRRRAEMNVFEGTLTPDGRLRVSQQPGAIFNNVTRQWHAFLSCGNISSSSKPFVDVEWITPSGDTEASWSYENDHFLFLLDNPITGGSYICRAKLAARFDGCLSGNQSHALQSVVTVDKMDARVTVLEAQNSRLREEVGRLKMNQNDGNPLSKTRVSFHARLNSSFAGMGTLASWHVSPNEGNAFDGESGNFTAPVSGTYFFAASAGTSAEDTYVHLQLSRDRPLGWLSFAYAREFAVDHPTMGSVQAVARLDQGVRVWLHSGTPFARYSDLSTSFSGFLLYAD